MTDFELHGPWTGNALHSPKTPRRFQRRRVFDLLIAGGLALLVLATLGFMLWLSNH